MANSVKIHVFKGIENEDLDQFWFIAKVVWETWGITDDQMKKSTLGSALQDPALTWDFKYSIYNQTSMLADIQAALNKEFSRPKSKAQSLVGLKEITMKPSETP